MQHFFNTISAVGNTLKVYNEEAQLKKSEILKLFRANPERDFITHEIEKLTGFNHDTVKRSITGLTDAGSLVRSEKAHKMGPYGKMVNTWRLAI